MLDRRPKDQGRFTDEILIQANDIEIITDPRAAKALRAGTAHPRMALPERTGPAEIFSLRITEKDVGARVAALAPAFHSASQHSQGIDINIRCDCDQYIRIFRVVFPDYQ